MGAGASVPASEEEALALGYTADDIRRYQEAKQQEENKDGDEEDDDAPLAPLPTKFSSPKESDHPALLRRVSVIERKLASHGKAGEGGGASAWVGSETLKPSDFDPYVAFVPRRMLPRLPAMATTKPSATMEKLEGVVSFLDLAGFTKLTERLALQPDGAERLAKIINKLMGQLLDTLKTGDTIKFSGDAICVLYEPDRGLMGAEGRPSQKEEEGDSQPGSESGTYQDLGAMRHAAYRAVSEGLEALFDDYTVPVSELGTFGDSSSDDPVASAGIKLALHVAITAGQLQFTNVGGVFGRWEVLLAGPAMLALGPTADRAPTDWCTVHPECWALLEGLNGPPGGQAEGAAASPSTSTSSNPFIGQHMGPGAGCVEFQSPDDAGFVRVTVEPGRVETSSPELKLAFSGKLGDYRYPKGATALSSKEWGETMDMAHHFLGRDAVEGMHVATLEVLRRYVAPLLQKAIKVNALSAISCFTDVSVLFLGMSDVDLGAMHPIGGDLWGQLIMATTQEVVFDHEGAVNKFVMDDKGALMLCAWGLPPLSHADDPYRCTSAALELADALHALGVKARIGVTTGKVFAGVIGPKYRCEFSILGDAVNLAARLMGKAPFGGVLCDQPTYESAVGNGSTFETLPAIRVKGKEALIPIYRPLWEGDETPTPTSSQSGAFASAGAAGNTTGDGSDGGSSSGASSSSAELHRQSSIAPRERRKAAAKADNFNSGASVLGTATHIRSAERAMIAATMERFFRGGSGGGMFLLSGDAGSGKSELAKMVLKSAKTYQARLIESLTPKHKGNARDVLASPCLELSQLLKGLLSPDAPEKDDNDEGDDGKKKKDKDKKEELTAEEKVALKAAKAAKAAAEKKRAVELAEAGLGPPVTVKGWRRRLQAALQGQPIEVVQSAHLFDSYFRDWCGVTSEHDDADASTKKPAAAAAVAEASVASKEGESKGEAEARSSKKEEATKTEPARRSYRTASVEEQSIVDFGDYTDTQADDDEGGGADAAARRVLLEAVLEAALAKEPLMLFVHVRTGSSLSANAMHPETWPLLMWLSAYAAARHAKAIGEVGKKNDSSDSSGSASSSSSSSLSHPLAVVFVNRRILDFGGQRQNDAVAEVVSNAAKCGGLLQLDPLDETDRSSYLCLALKVSDLPPEVHAWVSGIANGNPQYTEICAKALEKANVLEMIQKPPLVEEEGEQKREASAEALLSGSRVIAQLKGGADLKAVEPPPKIAGFIRSTLSSLGPEERLLTQILALYPHAAQPRPDPSADPRLPPRPTAEVLREGYETVAPIDAYRVDEVLQRLKLYGILTEVKDELRPNATNERPHEENDEEEGKAPPTRPVAHALIWPLLKNLASGMLLKNQKEAILDRLGAMVYPL